MSRSASVREQDAPGPGKRDAQPIRPVRQLVFDFVDRLLQQEEIEQAIGVAAGRAATAADRPASRDRRPERLRPTRSRQSSSARASLAVLVGRRFERALERRGRRIVDRADQAGDIARRRRLAPALLDAAPRLALEIDDEDVVLDDQHLAEMEVAVVADLHRLDAVGGSSSFRRCAGSASRCDKQRIDQRDGRPRSAALRRRANSSSARSARCSSSVGPGADVVGVIGSGAKVGNVVAARERELHFGDAPADLPHAPQIGGLLVAVRRLLRP